MKNYKKIHIWNLPTNKIYIKFNEKFSKLFFGLARDKFGSFRLVGEFINIKRGDTTISRDWKRGKTCYPLNPIIKLANRINISLIMLEKNIQEIKYKINNSKGKGSGGKPIINPKLPVVVNEDFIEIIGHLCGDGTISRSNPNKGISFGYINSEPKLIDIFQILMKKVFGNIEPNIIIRNGPGYRRNNFYLQYPSIISLFVLSIFDYKANELDFPPFIFNLSLRAKAKFLRAMFDDEGSIAKNSKKIQIGLKPIRPILDIKQLLIEFGIKTGSIQKTKSFNRLEIAEQESVLLFSKLIGFKHPKKIERLNKILRCGWRFKRYNNYEARDKIIKILMKNPGLEVSQISNIIKRHKTTVREHLNNLEEENIVWKYKSKKKINKITHYFNLWEIKNTQND